jgi:hypothetical protein
MTINILLIGSSDQQIKMQGIDAKIDITTWEYLTPFNKYDLIFIDGNSINTSNVKICNKTRGSLEQYVQNGGMLIGFCSYPKKCSGYSSYGWLPSYKSLKPSVTTSKGLVIKKSAYEKFLEKIKDRYVIKCCFEDANENDSLKILSTTGEGKIIAVSLKYGAGSILCIPWVSNVGSVIEDWVKMNVTMKPLWFDSYQFDVKKDLLQKIKIINQVEKLLYCTDFELRDAIIEAFRALDFEVLPAGKGTEEDIDISYENFKGIIEVKGLSRSADRDDLRTLLDYHAANIIKTPDIKSIFIVNHYRFLEPSERKEPYTKAALDLADREKFCLLSSIDLYYAIEHVLKDAKNKVRLRNAIIGGVGLIKLS